MSKTTRHSMKHTSKAQRASKLKNKRTTRKRTTRKRTTHKRTTHKRTYGGLYLSATKGFART